MLKIRESNNYEKNQTCTRRTTKIAERGTNYNSVLIGVSEFIINVHGRRLRRALSSLKYIFKFHG